jgi:hypothetical protein
MGYKSGNTALGFFTLGYATKPWLQRLIPILLMGVSFTMLFSLAVPVPTLAASHSLEITGDGVTNPVIFTREELEEMEQHQYVYSSINTWPTKKWYVGEGVKLWDLLLKAGIKEEEATLLRFTAEDGFTLTLTYKELFEDKRYLFPEFKTGGEDEDGHIPGSPASKVEVDPIVALLGVEGSDDPEYMNTLNSLQLMVGQRAVTEQTGNLFVKYLHKIEVLTDEPERWDAPQANPPSGTIPRGSMVTLSNLNGDDDKIHYTTDGSVPTIESPMYNWIASRWWSARADVLGTINRPIGPINQETTIKAVTIGPGKLDSEVVTFHYRVEDEDARENSVTILLTLGQREASVDGKPFILDAAPYLNRRVGRTLVPIRFVSEALLADVAWDGETRQISISLGEKEIILTIGSSQVRINGLPQTIDCPPELHPSGRTFVPLRFISEVLGAQDVSYDNASGQITIIR